MSGIQTSRSTFSKLTSSLVSRENIQWRRCASTRNVVGNAVTFSMTENHAFRKFGLPRTTLVEFRMLSKPCSVVRKVTLETLEMLSAASPKSSLETRAAITGSPGCGKSFLLMQAVEYCTSNNWMILYIPRAVKLVDSTTTYVYDSRTRTYLQPTFCYQTLQRFLSVNKQALGALRTQESVLLGKQKLVPSGTPLSDLINAGLKDQGSAPTVFSALLEELGKQTEYPVLLAIDDLQALYCETAYRDPRFIPIKPYHLSMPRLLLEFICGRKSFARGAVLGATTASDPVFRAPTELRQALGSDDQPPDPYTKMSSALKQYTAGLQKITVPDRLSVVEAAALFEVWMEDRALHSGANDGLFMSKYSESGGNARDFVWKGLLSTLEP